MLQISIVVFREILEISLILGILVAATKNVPNRGKWIAGGLVAGFFGALSLAFFTDKISDSLDGMGQEIFNGIILLSASFMISWTVMWMQKHARSLSGQLKALGSSIKEGHKSLYVLLFVVFFSVLREGAEIVLFTYSSYISGIGFGNVLLGLMVGSICGISVGACLYLGIIKASGKYFFIVTTWILVFLAAGITASGIGFLINGQVLPSLGDPIWDSSALLSQTSFFGQCLHIFMGYIDRPAGMQVVGYVANVTLLIVSLTVLKKKR